MEQAELNFDGATYEEAFDRERLGKQHRRVFELMRDGIWRTFVEIESATGDPPASISARLRDERSNGLFEYQLTGAE